MRIHYVINTPTRVHIATIVVVEHFKMPSNDYLETKENLLEVEPICNHSIITDY